MAAVSVLLAVLLWMIGVVVGVVLLLAAAVLLMPLDFGLRLDASVRPDAESEWGISGTARWSVDAHWGWWVLRVAASGEWLRVTESAVRLFGVLLPARRRERAPEKPPAQKKKRRFSLNDLRSFGREGLALVRRLIAHMRLRLRGNLVFGFADPSVTGMTLATFALTGTPGELRLQPDWLDPHFEGWLEAEGRIYGYELASAFWIAYWRSPMGDRLRERMRGIFRRSKSA